MIDGYWLPSNSADPRAFALYRRHYSAEKNAAHRQTRGSNFMGPGECMVLLTIDCDAVFAWQFNQTERYDKQEGVICTIFRNESPVLSSTLIREACSLAWQRWPNQRLFTYVNDAKVRRKRDPGRCFIRAGWRVCGRNKDGRLTILELLPESQPEGVTCEARNRDQARQTPDPLTTGRMSPNGDA